jgi:O-Antigen ligase
MPKAAVHLVKEAHWGSGFLGLFAYFIVEYMQLPLQYPVLQPLVLGKVTVAVGALGWLLAPKTKFTGYRPGRQIDILILVLMAGVLLCTLSAQYVDLAWKGFIDVARLGVVYFIISRLVDNYWRLRATCFIWLLLNLKIGQFVCRTYSSWHAAGANEMMLVSHGIGGTGFFGNSADLGVAMCVIWPVAVYLLLSKPKPVYRLVLIATSVACLGAIFLCGSRGAVVGAAAIGLAAFAKNPKRIATVFMIILLGIAIWFVLPEASRQRFRSARDPNRDFTAHHRLSLWKAGIQMWEDHPLLGVGLSNYPIVRWQSYPIDIDNHVLSVPHSTYIEGISELGLVGLTPMLLLWVTFFRVNADTRNTMIAMGPQQRQSFEYCLATGLDLGLVGYLASGAFVAVLWYPHIFVLLGFSVAVNNIARRKQTLAEQPLSRDAEPLAIPTC